MPKTDKLRIELQKRKAKQRLEKAIQERRKKNIGNKYLEVKNTEDVGVWGSKKQAKNYAESASHPLKKRSRDLKNRKFTDQDSRDSKAQMEAYRDKIDRMLKRGKHKKKKQE